VAPRALAEHRSAAEEVIEAALPGGGLRPTLPGVGPRVETSVGVSDLGAAAVD
jgi:hypothetical protein